MPELVKTQGQLQPGDIYEHCSFHPCLCVGVDGDEVWGISLVDGTYPRACSIKHCSIRKLTLEEAWQWRTSGPPDIQLEEKSRWW